MYSEIANNIIKLTRFVAVIIIMLLALRTINAQETNQNMERDSIIIAAKEIISHVKYCALVTLDSNGTANVRTMNPFPPEEDMTVWMATNTKTRKYEEIKKNPAVTLYYANHASAEGYVTITGKAFLVDDYNEKLKRKRDYWEQSFPDWKYLVLIKIVPEKLEVINYKRKMMNEPNKWAVPSILFNND
ncbi:MAG: pyridoxamine 5'-phosphate oxidase family protein [Melioribacteraceae bacterium]|nr:pyridoxamine 5'-phosphate oxidase family protein [Melioribacteraceae bacterium]